MAVQSDGNVIVAGDHGIVVDGIASRRGVVHSYTLFTGYFPRRVRGEMRSYQVMAAP